VLISTYGMLVDAYRELNHKKLFWISLIVSAVVVAAIAIVGINEKGLTFLHWQLDSPEFSTLIFSKGSFYKWVFVTLGIKLWLAWAATILALVSTASIFPDFLTGGAIDLWLSKPISRLRLFLTKYAFGLLFVALQVTVFTSLCWLVLGLRGGVWEPRIFLAIPIVLCFFSYLFAFSTLFGVVTRSTIAALLLTVGVWFMLFLVNSAEGGINAFLKNAESQLVNTGKRIAIQEKRPTPNESRLAQLREEQESWESAVGRLRTWHSIFYNIKTVVPKTDETIELLDRKLIDLSDVPGMNYEAPEPIVEDDTVERRRRPGEFSPEAQIAVLEERRSRSVGWIIGTSMGFQALVLALAAWVFCRRDY